MKQVTFAAVFLAVLSLKAGAAQFKSSTFEQASDLASGQTAPAMYDGAHALPPLPQMGLPAAPASAAAAPQIVAAAPVHPVAPRIENVPMPEGMEIASLPRESAPAKAGSTHDLAAPLGALIGMTAGFGIGLGLSKVLA